VIPASGDYELKPAPTGRQPHCISARDDSVLSFAGLWDEWHDAKMAETVKSCTIIVTGTNAFMWIIHDRIPVILKQFETWLAGNAGVEILKSAQEEMPKSWPVSWRVNPVGNDDDPKLIDAIQ
jgi:putative SOS response-associated peptidase YedK